MQLSPHFSLNELCRSELAERHDITNIPTSDEVIENLRRLAVNVLEPVRSKFGPFRPNSGYRSLKVNELAGSKPSSQHVKGQAADIEIPGIHNYELAEFIAKNMKFDQLLLEFMKQSDPTAGWVHVSWVSETQNRNSVLKIDSSGAVPFKF